MPKLFLNCILFNLAKVQYSIPKFGTLHPSPLKGVSSVNLKSYLNLNKWRGKENAPSSSFSIPKWLYIHHDWSIVLWHTELCDSIIPSLHKQECLLGTPHMTCPLEFLTTHREGRELDHEYTCGVWIHGTHYELTQVSVAALVEKPKAHMLQNLIRFDISGT